MGGGTTAPKTLCERRRYIGIEKEKSSMAKTNVKALESNLPRIDKTVRSNCVAEGSEAS